VHSGKQSDKWEKIPRDKSLVENALRLAGRDVRTANDVFSNKDYDWAFSIAYNAMLQAGRALMFSEGYRPKGDAKHVSVVTFIEEKFGDEFAGESLFVLNKIRKKRHIAVYEQVDIISEEEAENALNTAKEFVGRVKELVG
jgi:uncharacterized protein (UPF0332 family)